jgi:hypothetical protein
VRDVGNRVCPRYGGDDTEEEPTDEELNGSLVEGVTKSFVTCRENSKKAE